MKKLLMATLLLVLAALTETPDDCVLTGSGDKPWVDAYLSAWANFEADEVQFVEDQFVDEQALEIDSGAVNMDAQSDSVVAI
jgi:hypothetical protein